MIAIASGSWPPPDVPLEPLLAFLGSLAIWPLALIALVVVVLSLLPPGQRVAGLRALADVVRAARGRDVDTSRPAGLRGEDTECPTEATDTSPCSLPNQRTPLPGAVSPSASRPPTAR